MDFNVKNFGRDDAASIQIDTIPFAHLCKLAGADGLMPSESARYGTRIFLTKDGERVKVNGKNFSAIRLGKSVSLDNDLFDEGTAVEALKELINDHVVYYGINTVKETDGDGDEVSVDRHWIAFGKPGELTPNKVYTLKELSVKIGATA